MSRLLEITYDHGPVLGVAFEAQRPVLRESLGSRYHHVDLVQASAEQRARVLRTLSTQSWDTVFVRGVRGLREALGFFPKARFFLDHVGSYGAGPRGELSQFAHRLVRAFCYSAKADDDLRHMGLGRITALAGPFLPALPAPAPSGGPPVLGLLDFGYGTRQALARIKKVRKLRGWDFEIVTTMRDSAVRRVEGPFEVAEECNLLVCPDEGPDEGLPHQGVLLALSVGRALATSYSSSLRTVHATSDGFLHVPKCTLGAFGTCWDSYRRSRARLDAWPATMRTDHTELPRELIGRM